MVSVGLSVLISTTWSSLGLGLKGNAVSFDITGYWSSMHNFADTSSGLLMVTVSWQRRRHCTPRGVIKRDSVIPDGGHSRTMASTSVISLVEVIVQTEITGNWPAALYARSIVSTVRYSVFSACINFRVFTYRCMKWTVACIRNRNWWQLRKSSSLSNYYSALRRGSGYCDEPVCLSVCLFLCFSVSPRAYFRNLVHAKSSPNVCVCYPTRSSSGGVAISYVLPA